MDPKDCASPRLIDESSLDRWEVIGSGGFGQVFKARHVHWVWDVAIKILHYDNGSNANALLREAELMRRGESPYVVRVSGVFKGRLPKGGPLVHVGLVMDYMEQGTLADLQGTVCGPPPWPLAFRLAHQVALGMNFLHTLSPPLLHLDLKPKNVLLDSSLNVKLADFGLARSYHSVSRRSKGVSMEGGGTACYMPPEAFSIFYKPTCASDMYSYGILLWSILTGEKPFSNAFSSLVRLRIPEGDRPSLDEINTGQAEGLAALVQMMCQCWATEPQQRPSFLDCISVTEEQYHIHKSDINNAVHDVHMLLEKKRREKKISEGLTKLHITQPLPNDEITGPSPVQETAETRSMKNRVLDSGTGSLGKSSSQPMSFSETKRFPPSTNEEAVSSAVPNHAPESDTPPVTHQKEKSAEANFRPILPGACQRQFSNPEAFNKQPAPLQITMSNVTGFQLGNNNYMHLGQGSPERRRHPTAPPCFNTTPPYSGSHKGQTQHNN